MVFHKFCKPVLTLLLMLGIFMPALVVYGAGSASEQSPSQGKRASPKEQVIYTDINETYLGVKTYFKPDDGSDYFAAVRIDVTDQDGRVAQAMVYVCRGSESYTENFRKYIAGLEAAYSEYKAPIAGYLDLWWDNRIRNWIPYDYFGVQQVTITDPDGFTHEATVVAVSVADELDEPQITLKEKYLEGYFKWNC